MSGVIEGLDRTLPVLLLPVRLETRFDDDAVHGRVLRVRIYPDDIHIDDHEPLLSKEEVDWGNAYWSAIDAHADEAEAWAGLVARTGPYRALHVRETTAQPDPPVRPAGTSRAAVARALPDAFVVRVRAGTFVVTVQGQPVVDALQVGVDMSDTATESAGPPSALDKGMLWMTDFAAAEAAGMGITVGLPPGTEVVDDVTVTGVRVSLPADESARLLGELIASHRVTHGAGFIAAGTPTNNLADTTSGFTSRPDPSRLDPAARPLPGADSHAALTSRALGMPVDALASLPGAADRDQAEAKAMQRALFETTWGPFLRQQGQPGFPLYLMPRVYRFVTGYVRGGGPLPAIRLGRQPYGILPIAPAGWRSNDGDVFVTWLGKTLPELRRFWLAGASFTPSGLAAYSHEAVSTRVRIRSVNASSTASLFQGFGLGEQDDPQLSSQRLLAEVGIEDAMPSVATQLFTKGKVNLWLPMSVDGDTDVVVSDPRPKEAKSILGLLLRNAALQVTSAAADEYRAGMTGGVDPRIVAYAVKAKPFAAFASAQGVAISTTQDFSVERVPALNELLALQGRNAAGEALRISDGIADLLTEGRVPNLEAYANSDAVIAFREALADIAAIPPERRARLTGEAIDTASHRYDAWVTALATRRLETMRATAPTGIRIGSWGYVQNVRRRPGMTVPAREDLPAGTVTDPANHGFVLAPSIQHATVASVMRAAYIAHGGPADNDDAPFAVSLDSHRLRAALDLATGMRNGQPLGALLGYRLERYLHDVSGQATTVEVGGVVHAVNVEVDWMVYELRRRFPLKVTTGEQATAAAQRLVADGWAIAQKELDTRGTLVAELTDGRPADEALALQAALDALVSSLDGLSDLALAESVQQLAGRNLDRAAAAADMIGRAGLPPDRFDVAATPRGGRGIEQRLLIAFAGTQTPGGWASGTPRALLAPEANAFLAERLGHADGIVLRLLSAGGTELGRCELSTLGLSALDLAADAASTGNTTPFPLLLHRARQVTGETGAAIIGMQDEADADLRYLLAHAAAWHRALAGRPPLGAASVRMRGLAQPDTHDDVRAALQVARAALAACDIAGLCWWGLHVPDSAAAGQKDARLKSADTAVDVVAAARALFGGDVVLTGATGAIPADLAGSLADPQGLGTTERGVVAGWLQDAARVRAAAMALEEAFLHGEGAGRPDLPLAAAQTPAAPYANAQGALPDRAWIGQAFPDGASLGGAPVMSVVLVGSGAVDTERGWVGIELDSWPEMVPSMTGSAAIAANISAPDARAPNTCLLAIPADPDSEWTEEALFSVVDEALSLATCRAVDLDAARRIPALLPAIYLSEYEEPEHWRDFVVNLKAYPMRYVAKGSI